MRDFELLEPQSPEQACKMLADSGEEARLLAGGTALLLGLRQRLVTPSHVVYLGGVPGLEFINFDEASGLEIGALTKIATLASSEVIRTRYPIIAAMAGQVANPQVRNAATIGGNLSYGDPALDPPTCLIALDAALTVLGPKGSRSIKLVDFYRDYFLTALGPDELVTRVHIPPVKAHTVGIYTRFTRTPAEHRPLVGIAVVASPRDGACRDARVTIGASTPTPVRAKRTEQFLEGKRITQDVLREAAGIAAAEIEPLSDSRGSADYRRQMVEVVFARTAARALGIATP